jgi:hypothetical protein
MSENERNLSNVISFSNAGGEWQFWQ